jgi:hypothetical protein
LIDEAVDTSAAMATTQARCPENRACGLCQGIVFGLDHLWDTQVAKHRQGNCDIEDQYSTDGEQHGAWQRLVGLRHILSAVGDDPEALEGEEGR